MLKLSKNNRRFWTKPELHEEVRNKFGAYATVFCAFRLYDSQQFFDFVHMKISQFAYLHALVEPFLAKKRARRSALPSYLKLAAVLKYTF